MLSHPSAFPPIGQPFNLLASVDSTNNYATAQVREGLATHGSAFMTLEQTQGRGQRGKTWLTTPGENILLTIIMRAEPMDVINPFVLSAKAALGCYDFFKDWAGPDMTRIKWPNDLYWQDRKAGGILIESISGSAGPDKSLLFAVGIGININQTIFDPKVRNPVSLKQITGKTYDIVELGKTLCKHLEKWYHAPVEDVHAAYNAVLFRRGRRVRLRKDLIVFDTTIVGVSPSGHLVTQDPLEREFLNGEVEWLLDPPSPIQ